MPEVELQGVVVDRDPTSVLDIVPSPHDGLYLQTDDGLIVELIRDSMATQVSIDFMWRGSRRTFEPYLGQRITVHGYLSHRRLYSAVVTYPLRPIQSSPED